MTRSRRYYVGLAASLHDPAVAILNPEGKPLFAEATERYLQNKRAYHATPDDLIRIPRLVRQLCDPDDEVIVAVSWSDQMLRNMEHGVVFGAFMDPVGAISVSRQMEEFAWPLPGPELMLTGSRNSLSQAGVNLQSSRRIPNPVVIRRYDHHLAHAAHAALTSPFDEVSVAIIDGYGEGRSTSFFRFLDGKLETVPGQGWDSKAESRQHVSLGHFYARICAACSFDPILGEEWKVMGLASYGRFDEHIAAVLRPMMRVSGLGLSIGCSDKELAERLSELKAIARKTGEPAENFADLAATGQQVFEDLSTELLLGFMSGTERKLALSGGCALNSSYNGRILERTPFRRLHVPSAPADDGCALGAAILAFVEDHPGVRVPQEAASAYLGSSIPTDALGNLKKFSGLGGIERTREALIDEVSEMLKDGLIVGLICEEAEFGPRALGHRSILADARREGMKDRLNAIVKFREEFRPFAPSILDEHGEEYFENYQTSRYMERTLRFRRDKVGEVPAVVHVDGTGRLQSVRREWSPLYYDLIAAFYRKTGVPLILNTSLNVMGKPIAHSLEDGLGIFFTSGLDVLVVENFLIRKSEVINAI